MIGHRNDHQNSRLKRRKSQEFIFPINFKLKYFLMSSGLIYFQMWHSKSILDYVEILNCTQDTRNGVDGSALEFISHFQLQQPPDKDVLR